MWKTLPRLLILHAPFVAAGGGRRIGRTAGGGSGGWRAARAQEGHRPAVARPGRPAHVPMQSAGHGVDARPLRRHPSACHAVSAGLNSSRWTVIRPSAPFVSARHRTAQGSITKRDELHGIFSAKLRQISVSSKVDRYYLNQ